MTWKFENLRLYVALSTTFKQMLEYCISFSSLGVFDVKRFTLFASTGSIA